MAVENITLNIIPTGDTPSIHAAQYDVDRPFTITLKEGADDFTPTGYDIELQVRKVDSNIVTAIPTSTSGNVVTFNTTEQMTACSGTNLAELELTKDGQSFATLHFYLVVQRDVLVGGLTSQSEIYDLEEQIAAIVPEVIGDEYYTAEEVDEKIAEIPTFDPTNYYTKSQLYTKTETNGLLAQKANTSSLAAVAISGSYNDLLNKPNIPDVSDYYTKAETYSQDEVNTLLSTKADASSLSAVATSGDYDDLINKPTLSTVATSGSYDDLTDKPTIPTNAEQLPIESGSATNTKDYIDTKVGGKQDTLTVEKDTYPITTYGGTITCLRYGNIVSVILSAFGQTQAPATGSAYTLGTIASKYRPDMNLRVVGYANYSGYKYDGVQAYAVNADGTIVTYNYGGPAITSGNFTVTFVKE